MPKKKDVFTAIQDLKGEEFTRDEIADRMGAGTTGEKAIVFSLIAALIREDLVDVLEADRYKQPVRLREKRDSEMAPIPKDPIPEKPSDAKVIMCTRCGENPAVMNSKTGRPVNGLCGFCRQRKLEENKGIQETETLGGLKTCTKCRVPKPIEGFFSGRNVCKACYRIQQSAAKRKIYKAKKDPISTPEASVPLPISDEVEILNLPLPGGISKEFMNGLRTAGDKAFRPWWYQATFYICEGLRKDGYL